MSENPLVDTFDPARAMLVASRSPLALTCERAIDRSVPTPGVALVAVSGGPDSTALLLLATALMSRRTPSLLERLVVGHVDHGLRPEAEQEADQVRGLAEGLGLEFAMERLVWPDESPVSSGRAREARWSALHGIAIRHGAGTILCGHHADDQAETVLLRLARGTGLTGLAGIPEMRRLDDEVRIVRPLLQARRGELLELIEAAGVSVATDPTNERRDSARGMVRHEVLPRLEHLHPGATGRIAATAEEAGSLIRDGLENPRVPVPDSIRWSREVLAGLDEVTVSGSIRESIRSLPGIRSGAVEAVPRAVWSAMARAVLDEEERPREFELSGLGAIRVEARWIRWRSEPGRSDESPTLPS